MMNGDTSCVQIENAFGPTGLLKSREYVFDAKHHLMNQNGLKLFPAGILSIYMVYLYIPHPFQMFNLITIVRLRTVATGIVDGATIQ